jgi:putative SbcD/Mre11-related phosphoesterase
MFRFIDNEPALMLQVGSEKILVVSDLHIGYERTLADKGVKIPSLAPRLYEKLEQIIFKQHPDRVMLSGDIKHGTVKLLPHEWTDVPGFFEKLLSLGIPIEVVSGNHDGGLEHLLPREVGLHSPRGAVTRNQKRILVTHGHTWPTPTGLSADIVVMGHNHFSVEFREASGIRKVEPVWVVAHWNSEKIASEFLHSSNIKYQGNPLSAFQQKFGFEVGNPTIIIVPAFNPMLNGMKINRTPKERYISPILQHGIVDMEQAEIYLLDHTYLGLKKNLQLSDID